jgi:K(+)-stimulated pyrophosphate-energized sodium pump
LYFLLLQLLWGAYALGRISMVWRIAASAMMATTAMQLAVLMPFGPIADNAGGIAEMSGLPEEVREQNGRVGLSR